MFSSESFTCFCFVIFVGNTYIGDITRRRENLNFMLEWQKKIIISRVSAANERDIVLPRDSN